MVADNRWYDLVVDLLVSGLPRLTRHDAAAVLEHAGITANRSLRALAEHLGERGHELVIGPNTEPWPLVQLVYALHRLGRTDVVRPACAGCGVYSANLIRKNSARQRICGRCYQQPTAVCGRCRRERPIVRRGRQGQPPLCNGCYQGPIMTCSRCGRQRACPRHADGQPVCYGCMTRPTHTCTECGQDRPAQAFWPIGPVCRPCYGAARANPRPCPSCNLRRALIAEDEQGQRICGGCGGADNDHACRQCGTAGNLYTDRRCAACVLPDRVAALLTDTNGAVPPHLAPVRDALSGAERPHSMLAWISHSPTATGLARLAADGQAVSHAQIDELAVDLDVRHLRAILISTGVLTERHERLEQAERWIDQTLADRPSGHALLVRPFAQWVVLRRARSRAAVGAFTQSSAGWIHTRVLVALQFLAWLDSSGVPLARATQTHLDQWLNEGTTYRYTLRPFMTWARQRGLTRDVEVPKMPVGSPVTSNGDHLQWEQLKRCLQDTTMPLDIRVAGSLLLLFGISASKLVRIQAGHIEQTNGATHLHVADHALLLPPLLANITLQQRDRTDLRSALGRTSANRVSWLFPGLRPGRSMDAPSLAAKLNDHGIKVRAARNTALAQLAADLPPKVLAELVGIGVSTAARWARHANRDWNPYIAARTHDSHTAI
jgi:hypothetical protein